MIDYIHFRSYLIVKNGIGDICAKGYCDAVKRFHNATGIAKPTEEDAIKYVLTFYERKMSYNHIVNTCLALERYSEYIGTPFHLGRPKKPKRVIRDTLSEQEIARMYTIAPTLREKALVAILAYSGLRNLELCRLKVKDIDFHNSTIFVHGGKGHKDAVICVSPMALNAVQEYLKAYPRTPEQTVFSSVALNRAGDQLKPAQVRKYIHKLAYFAGIKRRVWPHLLRHSLAMNMLYKGADLWTVREQLRHSYIETTLIYISSNTKILANRYQIFAPNYILGDHFAY